MPIAPKLDALCVVHIAGFNVSKKELILIYENLSILR
jgi:hypothetical protein